MADLTWVGDRGILVASDSGESLSPQPYRWDGGQGYRSGWAQYLKSHTQCLGEFEGVGPEGE